MLACASANDLIIYKIFLNIEVQKRSQKPIYPQTKQVRTGKQPANKTSGFGGSTLARRGGSLAHPTITFTCRVKPKRALIRQGSISCSLSYSGLGLSSGLAFSRAALVLAFFL